MKYEFKIICESKEELLEILRQQDTGPAPAATPGPEEPPAPAATPAESLFAKEPTETPSEPPPAEPPSVDMNGVPFNGSYCANSKKEHFYVNGPQQGQWRKGRKVPQALYDEWYAGALAALSQETPKEDESSFNPELAFRPAPKEDQIPQTLGELITWVAESDSVTQEDVSRAFGEIGMALTQFYMLDQEDQKKYIPRLFQLISGGASE